MVALTICGWPWPDLEGRRQTHRRCFAGLAFFLETEREWEVQCVLVVGMLESGRRVLDINEVEDLFR